MKTKRKTAVTSWSNKALATSDEIACDTLVGLQYAMRLAKALNQRLTVYRLRAWRCGMRHLNRSFVVDVGRYLISQDYEQSEQLFHERVVHKITYRHIFIMWGWYTTPLKSNDQASVYRLRAWRLHVVCDISIEALSLCWSVYDESIVTKRAAFTRTCCSFVVDSSIVIKNVDTHKHMQDC